MEVYCLGPGVVVTPSPDRSCTPSRLRVQIACSRASSTSSVRMLVAARQPRMRRADLADDGSPLVDDDFLLVVDAWWETLEFTIPASRPGQS